ncbi:MAG: hypothetical protein K2J20_03725 [Bacilli bacterium]|nr:hypothetical protein [Bacilli bacterium]
MEIARVLENKKKGQIYGLMGNINLTTNNESYGIISDYRFPGTIKEYLNSPKMLTSLKMVMLNETYLYKKAEDLSDSEIKKVSLAKALLENKEYLIFDYFEKGFNYKEKENFKRLFKKLTTEYQKTIVLFTNDIEFLWDITDELILVSKDKVKTIPKSQIVDITSKLNKPEIIKFIDLMHSKNVDIEYYKNRLDLLKAIYRIKGE